MRNLLQKAFAMLLASAIWWTVVLPVRADETRYNYDENFPYGNFSTSNFRAALRSIDQGDTGPLKPMAKWVIDPMDYTTNAAATAQYSGTGVTITAETTVKQEGDASLKAVIDATNDRAFGRTFSINLVAFTSITVWTRCTSASSAIQFYLSDGTNSSYWNVTTDAVANTWKQHTLTLASPDANSGSPASLSAITSYGYRLLDNGKTYYFDTVKAIVGMKVAVRGTNLGEYYRHVYFGVSPLSTNAQGSPTITAPTTNPRIDILTIDSSGTLAWVTGTEASSPSAPWSSMPTNKIPIALVYNKTTETKILDYEDKDTDSNQGYIYADVRPFVNLAGGNLQKGADVASASAVTLGNDGNVFDITGTTTITSITAKPAGTVVWLQFDGILTVTDGSNLKLNGNFVTAAEAVLCLMSDGTNWYEVSRQPTASTFLGLTDTPDSYSSQANKVVHVNAGASALEFRDDFNTSSGHDHDGSDSKKVVVTNVDPTGVTDGYLVKRSGSAFTGQNPALESSMFKVRITANGTTASFDETDGYDTNSNFASNRFTASIAGKYHIDLSFEWTRGPTGSGTTLPIAYLKKNGIAIHQFKTLGNATAGNGNYAGTVSGGVDVDLAVNDYLEIQAVNDNDNYLVVVNDMTRSWWSGHLIPDGFSP